MNPPRWISRRGGTEGADLLRAGHMADGSIKDHNRDHGKGGLSVAAMSLLTTTHRRLRKSVKNGARGLPDFQRYIPLLLILQVAIGFFVLLYMRQHRAPQSPRSAAAQRRIAAGSKYGGIEVRAVAADTGGWNAIAPVLEVASKGGAAVSIHLSGASARGFLSGKLQVDTAIQVTISPEVSAGAADGAMNRQWTQASVKSFVGQVHDVSLVATSASLEGINAAVEALCSSSAQRSLSIVEDMYRVSGGTLEGVVKSCPERVAAMRLCVPDPGAHSLATKAEPGRTATQMGLQVSLCGGPQFDDTARAAATPGVLHARRAELRKALRLSPRTLLVLAVGQVHGTAEMASMLVEGLDLAREAGRLPEDGVAVLLRMHPRANPEDKESALAIKAVHPEVFPKRLEEATAQLGRSMTSEDLLPAADVVISGHSTVNYHAILWGMPGVVYLGTATEEEQMRKEKGLTVQPEVQGGAAWRASTAEEFAVVLDHMAQGGSSEKVQDILKSQQGISRANDGRAAARVWHHTLATDK